MTSSTTSTQRWDLYTNNHPGRTLEDSLSMPLPPPPWRSFDGPEDSDYKVPELPDVQRRRGSSFRLPRDENGAITPQGKQVLLAVNAAIHLRRPLLVTGHPGVGKSSLAYSIAHELGLGRVLWWPVTPRSELEHGLYRYEALDRLRDSGAKTGSAEDYITLGPLGTAFVPLSRPRVLLIDEIDKSDLQLPNELLHLFEEGAFTIPQLRREARQRTKQTNQDTTKSIKGEHGQLKEEPAQLDTDDENSPARIKGGRVQCHAFPIVVMTSNDERDFPAAFYRRCIRVQMPAPTQKSVLEDLITAQFGLDWANGTWQDSPMLSDLIKNFLASEASSSQGLHLAVDQFLNAAHLLLGIEGGPSGKDAEDLRRILFRPLSPEG
jgi:MoxR-like ATPase